jgi:dihydrolipoamide dehydrogenase
VEFDVTVLGGGPGGYVAAIRAAQLGLKTALIEEDRLGGVCLNWGCIPSKALLRNAEIVNLFRRSDDFGIAVSGVKPDMAKAQSRSREVVEKMVKGVEFLVDRHKIELRRGRGRLEAANRVRVGDETIESANIILATGASPKTLPFLPESTPGVLFAHGALELTAPPKSIAIIGAGAIGMEFAYYFNAYGSEVTLLEFLPHLVPAEDEEVSRVMEQEFQKLGIAFHTGANVIGADIGKKQVVLTFKDSGGETREIAAGKVLVGIGVSGNSEGIGLEELGVDIERTFVTVDDRMRTNVSGIYAIGDVTGPPLLAHVASAQGVIAAEVIAGLEPPRLDYDQMPRATYAQPQIASIGLTEKQAKERGRTVQTGKFPFSANGKATALGDTQGFAKVVADVDSGQILGAHVVGHDVSEMLGELSLASLVETTPRELGFAVHPHPTLSEAIKEAALAVDKEAIHIWQGQRGGGR